MKITINETNKKINAIVPYVIEHNDRLQIYPELVNTAKEKRDRWNELYPIYLDDMKRTKYVTAEINELKVEIDKIIRDIRQFVKHGPVKDELNADDRLIFDLPESSPHTRIPIPTRQLILATVLQGRRMFKIQASFVSLPGFNDGTVISKEVKGINVLIAVKDVGDNSAPTESDFTRKEYFTKSTFEIFFEEEDIQKTAYMKAALVNPTGEIGPYGEAIKFVIPS